MYQNPLLSRIISGLSSSLNIASKVIPLYEKAKPMTNNVKKVIRFFKQNNHTKIKNVSPKTENIFKQINNPTFFK